MYTILSLFGKSPFGSLQKHMEQVSACIGLLTELFESLANKNYAKADELGKKISEYEQEADLTKNDLRTHLPKSLYMPVDRSQLLEILTMQDRIADRARDVGLLVNIKPLELSESFKDDFLVYLDKTINTFNSVKKIMMELHELLESSFGGFEAEKVNSMIHQVYECHQEAELALRPLNKKLFAMEDSFSYGTFYLWQKIIDNLEAIADFSEMLANRMRMTLEINSKKT